MRAVLLLACLLASPVASGQDDKECVPLRTSLVKNVRVTSAIPQEDLQKSTIAYIRTTVVHTTPPTSAGIIGALIGATIADALINNMIKKKVEEASLALPALLEQTRDYDVREAFWARLEAALAEPGRLNPLDLTVFKSERGHFELGDRVRGEQVEGLLDLHTHYALTADLKSFVMTTDARIQNPGGYELYRCKYVFSTPPLVGNDADAAAAARAWAANGGAAYRAAVGLGIEQTMRMLRHDLLNEDPPRPAGVEIKIRETRIQGAVIVQFPVAATQIERVGNVLIGRDEKGILRSSLDAPYFVAASVPASVAVTERRAMPVEDTTLEDLEALLPAVAAAADAPASPAKQPPPQPAGLRTRPGAQATAGAPHAVELEDLKDLLPAN